MRRNIRQTFIYAATLLTFVAVLDQLRRPEAERDWHGSVLGVPYDFRRPSLQRLRDAWWNPDDPRLFTPRAFGLGWALNLPRLIDAVARAPRENGDG